MQTDYIMLIFDVVIFGYGVYMVYSARQMQETKQPPTILLNPMELVGARDIPGFCEAMYKPLILFGIMAMIYGIVGMVNDIFVSIQTVNLVSIGLFLIMCIWFFRQMKNNKTKYLK